MFDPNEATLDDYNDGGDDGGDAPDKVWPGMQFVIGGELYQVASTDSNRPKVINLSSPPKPGQSPFVTLPSGDYPSTDGKSYSIDGTGNIRSSRTLRAGEANSIGIGYDYSEQGGGGGGSGSGPSVYGARAPDPIGAANGLLQEYLTRVEVGAMPRAQALEEFQAKLNMLNAQLDNEMTQGQFAQNQANYTNQANEAYDSNVIRKQEANVSRDLGVANEFGSRAQSFVRDFLPTFVPGLTGVQLPGVGGGPIPVPQTNPDQIYGLDSLNNVSSVTHNPTAPVPIPLPNITPFDPNALPNIPQYTPPPIPPEIAALFGQGAGGFPGWVA